MSAERFGSSVVFVGVVSLMWMGAGCSDAPKPTASAGPVETTAGAKAMQPTASSAPGSSSEPSTTRPSGNDKSTAKSSTANASSSGAAAPSGAPSAMSMSSPPSSLAGGSTGASAAGSGISAAAGTSGSASAPSASMSTSGARSGAAPKLPEITGECPKFATGDWSFSGMTGVMEVGEKAEGRGALVFYWPGTDFPASAYTQVGDNNIERVTSEGGIIVSIQGSVEHALDTDCSITGYYSHDFEPIGQIAACAVRDYGIDPRRIYSTGCSAGGVTSGCMASRCSSYIAAVATNSGGLTSVEKIVDPSHIPAVMSMHGGAADFGGLFTTDSANLDKAIKQAGGFAINCDHGGGHCAASAELQNAAFEFLWAHPFGVDPLPYASGLPMSFPSYCKIY